MRILRALPTLFVAALAACGMAFFLVSAKLHHPELRIEGEWREVYWSYEKADPCATDIGPGAWLDEQLRREVSKGLLIHESEQWRFEPDGRLVLRKSGTATDTVQWRLKGRGHLLELVFGDAHQEHYQIRSLSDQELVLQFNSDLVARGIVKIVFNRTATHAQQIQ
jgi:hypothetical protein